MTRDTLPTSMTNSAAESDENELELELSTGETLSPDLSTYKVLHTLLHRITLAVSVLRRGARPPESRAQGMACNRIP